MGTLYIVATPIGNMEDITLRALKILESADYIACEDTRTTLKLLNHYKLKKKLISHYSYNEASSGKKILEFLKKGDTVALVSENGTPGISDPGSAVVHKARENNIPVVPVPGASACTALLSVSGYPARGVIFEGFLSPKKGKRKKQARTLLESGNGFILYESPYRIVDLLQDISSLEPERAAVVGREMTKKFEEFFHGPVKDILTQLKEKSTIKGEFTIFINGRKKS